MNELAPILDGASWVFGVLGVVSLAVFTVWLTVTDIRTRRLPNRVVAWGVALTLGLTLVSGLLAFVGSSDPAALWRLVCAAVGATVLTLIFLALWLVSPRGIGAGDVKIAPLVGGVTVYVGGVFALLICVVVASLVAVLWDVILRKRRSLTDVPFAPCLFGGAWVGLLLTGLTSAV